MNDLFGFSFLEFQTLVSRNLDLIPFLSNNKYSDYLYRLECKREESTPLCAQGNLAGRKYTKLRGEKLLSTLCMAL